MATTTRRCIGSARFGIEPHQAPVTEFPEQPSQKDGLGRMCRTHWNQYTAGLARDAKARKAAQADQPAEATAQATATPKPGRAKAKAATRAGKARAAKATTRKADEPTAEAASDAVLKLPPGIERVGEGEFLVTDLTEPAR